MFGIVCEEWVRRSNIGEFLDSRARTPERECGGRDEERRLAGERGAGFDGNKTENTWSQRSGPHLMSGPT